MDTQRKDPPAPQTRPQVRKARAQTRPAYPGQAGAAKTRANTTHTPETDRNRQKPQHVVGTPGGNN